MRKTILIFSCCAFFALAAMAQRTEALLEKNWKFTKGDVPEATQTNLDDSKWETVTIPHDWAIFGPFDRNNDLQEVAVTQDLEKTSFRKDRAYRRVALCGCRLVSYGF
jgi:beta-galactosidase